MTIRQHPQEVHQRLFGNAVAASFPCGTIFPGPGGGGEYAVPIGTICLVWGLLILAGTWLEVRRPFPGDATRTPLHVQEWLYCLVLAFYGSMNVWMGWMLVLNQWPPAVG